MENSTVVERFFDFYSNWICKLQEILDELLHVFKYHHLFTEQDLQSLVSKVTPHLKEYYTVKWGLAHEDVLVFFSPIWLTPLENANLWITGWKPSKVFKVLESLKKSQERKIGEVRTRTKMKEEKVEREMERQQVAMADTKIVELAKLSERAICKKKNNGADHEEKVQLAMKGVLGGFERITKASDCGRLKTLKEILDVLKPI